MAQKKSSTDEFANIALITLTESSANTLTFKKLETGISLNEKVAWLVSRVEYFTSGFNATVFNAEADNFTWGLAVSSSFTSAVFTETTIIDYNVVFRRDIGTAASGMFSVMPITKDFTALPGGGILVPPTPLYAFGVGISLASAMTIYCRLYYTLLELSTDQYWQLVEARRVLSS